MARIAELTLQNSAIKAHLNNIIGPWGEQGDGLRELNQQETSHTGDMTAVTTTKEDDKVLEDTTDETFTEGEESYLEDCDSCGENLEGSSSSLQDDYVESTGASQYMEMRGPAAEEAEEEVKKKISDSFFYDYMELVSKPFVTLDSNIPLDLLTLVHSFGYDCKKRANLQLLDSNTVMYIAGNQLIFLNLKTKEQMYLRSSSGRGIGVIGEMKEPDDRDTDGGKSDGSKSGGKQSQRSLQSAHGTDLAYAYVDFNNSGTLLASVGDNPDHTMTIWNWKEEQPILRTKAFSQDVFKVTFNPDNEEQLTTSGLGHIKFWEMALTFTGLKLQGSLGRFGKTATTDIEGYMELPDGKVLSGSEWGNMLLWEAGFIKVELCRASSKCCHQGPINQIMLDEGEVITIGSDGYIRIWDFEAIDTADTVDETGLLEIEPINELQVDKNVQLFSMIKMNEAGNNVWLAQDASGAIWKLDLSFSNITHDPECLFSFHSGAIEALAVSPVTYLMATTALDCSIRIYDFASRTPLAHVKFKQGGTALTWVPRLVSYNGAQIIVGFEDGVVRILELYDPKGLTIFAGRKKFLDADLHLKYVIKPHTAHVTALAYDRDGEILATGSKDKTVFFFEVENNYKPIGYISTPGPVCQLIWSTIIHPESTLLILCENGYVLEAACPVIKQEEEDHHRASYEIKDMRTKCFHFSSVKSKILRLIETEKRKKQKELKKKEKEERRKQLAAMMGEDGEKEFQGEEEEEEEEEEKPLPGIFIPSTPCHILCGFYSGPGKFWVSLGGYDSGFLYHCEFPPYDKNSDITEKKDEPFDFRFLEDTEDNPIQSITFSFNQDIMFCGMQDGAIRVYILNQNDLSLTDMENYWHFNIHDNNYGCIKGISTSFDDRFLVTAGADSNIFVFSIFSEFELRKLVKAKVPSPRFGIETEPIPEDIDDPKAYSIENARRKREHDKLMKEVEEIKARKREQLRALRSQFRKLLEMNEKLPKHMQFKRTDFDIDSQIRAEINKKTVYKIHQVEKELAWEREKHELGLTKLQHRFHDSLQSDAIVVHAIQSEHKISSYRLVKPSKYSRFKRASQSETRGSKLERFDKEASGIKDGQKDTGGHMNVPEDSIIEKGKHFRPKTLSQIMVENEIEKARKLMLKAERAQFKIQQRKKEWEELYKSKPDEDYEDPKDIQAIKEAQVYMGDFNLKTAPDYKIPEHMRINAAKKEEELGQLDAMTYSKKTHMNKCILSLRDLKVAVIEEIQCLVQEMKNIQSVLHISKHIPIPQVPQIHPEEVPEKRFHYDEKTLLAFKKQLMKSEAEKAPQVEQTGSTAEGGGFLRVCSGKDGDLTTRDSLYRSSKMLSLSLEIPKILEFEKADPTDVELEIMKRDEIKHVYMQQYLTNRIKELIVTFDAELHLLRHQKLKLDTQMKLSDLHHLTLFQEMLLLKNFEKQENILQERVNSLDKEEQDMQWKINEALKDMEEKKNEIARLQDQEKALYAGFQAALGENNKFANFLMKVLKKKIKRVKKKEGEGDADCDMGLFELTLQLREKRLDIEEALVEEKKIIDNLKKEHDILSKKIEHVVFGEIPSDLSGTLVFSNRSLRQLQDRIVQLQEENSKQQKLNKEFRERRKQLIREKREMSKTINNEDEESDESSEEESSLESGEDESGSEDEVFDDSVCPTICTSFLEMLGSLYLLFSPEKIAQVRWELMMKTKEHTRKLHQMNDLCVEKKKLDSQLNTLQNQQGNAFQGLRRADIVAREKVTELIQLQAERIMALKEEIAVLRKKGGLILPPIQPPHENR
ncbi:PREDICTED: cilia- and flagella-associated protein 44 [Hipposideros armiger]|uniref:Cilia- and flagella-associated protein 44 n=1 Tax=Hipposideros armiger TaxID=186990 RepID=A0A8B7S368_HIPAR|nr:PREDICTED: cilia- and flagella-associated protein 44 [Hipposideros armiger]